MKKYYLAYGSNLNVHQMKYRCPTARIVGTAVIRDYELLYKGSKTGSYLTIEKKKGGVVPVAVWEVTAADEHSLDAYEGCPNFYYKKNMEVTLDETGIRIDAFVYIMHEERKLGIPTSAYVQTCKFGYALFKFDFKYLDEAYEKSLKGGLQTMKTEIEERTCPKCGNTYTEHPALSRTDNKMLICPDCYPRTIVIQGDFIKSTTKH